MSTRAVSTSLFVALATITSVGTAFGQQAPTSRPGDVTVAAGGLLSRAYPVGDTTATLRRNTTGSTPPPFTLLRAESEMHSGVGVEARVAVALTSRLALEAGGSYSTSELGITISEDAEAPGQPAVSEQVDQYIVEVSGVYQFPLSFGRRARPYAVVGGGYLRQLYDGRLLVETGRTLHMGGGVQYWWRGTNTQRRPVGLRAETRFVRRSGGIEFANRARTFPTFSVLAFIGL